ncbi:MAG: class I SAM-dependent methyltransferase [Pseudorhodoplanes sp.]
MAAAAFSEAEAARWYEGKSFTSDWTSWHFPRWAQLFAEHRERPVRVLEIGSWEGRSALFFMNYLPRARLTCVDPWTGNFEHAADPHFAALVPESERRFDGNVARFADRIEKIKGASSVVLPRLGVEARSFEIIYVDGSHIAADVFADGALAWPLLARGGLMVFDDYEWYGFEDAAQNPKLGIDAFLAAYDGAYKIVERGYQIVISRI